MKFDELIKEYKEILNENNEEILRKNIKKLLLKNDTNGIIDFYNKNKIDIDFPINMESEETLLNNAIRNNNLELIKFAINNGADVNKKSKKGYVGKKVETPLNSIVLLPLESQYKIAKLLINAGASLDNLVDYKNSKLDSKYKELGEKRFKIWINQL